jgi:DNA-binding transcriptional ArsR family regulator
MKSPSPLPGRTRPNANDDDVLVIRDADTLRIVSHPLRLQMLELMRERSQTATELATALHVSRTKLYYHLNLLAEHGLITVAETRLVSGIVEKQYRVTAYRMTVDKALIGPTSVGNEALDTYVWVVLDEVRTEINRSVDAGLIDLERTHEDNILPRRLVLGRKWLRLTPDQVADFSERYSELLDEFEAAASLRRRRQMETGGNSMSG